MFLRHPAKLLAETPSVSLFCCLRYVPFCILSFIQCILHLRMRKRDCFVYHTRAALKHKKTQKTDLSLETRSEINFEFGKFVSCLPLTKQIGNIQGLVILDLS